MDRSLIEDHLLADLAMKLAITRWLVSRGIKIPEDHTIELGKGEITSPEGNEDGLLEIEWYFQRLPEEELPDGKDYWDESGY